MKKALIIVGLLLLFLTACTENNGTEYTVFFESNGGTSISEVTISEGTILNEPDQPIREGYSFEGWYEDINLTIVFIFSNQISEDLTIYAKWEPLIYHLIFLDDDETVLQDNEYAYGDDLTTHVPPEVTSETGYHFNGWDTAIPSTMPAYNLTLQAQYQINSYQVIFNDYDGTLISSVSCDYGSDLSTISLLEPTRAGYSFVGWNEVIPSIMPASNLVFEAQYQINSYQVTFKDYDGTLISSFSYDYGSDLSDMSIPQLTKEGYTFEGWDIAIPITMPANDLILQAEYTINSYQLIFMYDQETVISTTSYDYGDNLTEVITPEPVKEGYTFTGWNNMLPDIMPASDVRLTAIYAINRYTLTYVNDDDTIIYTDTFYYQTSLDSVSVTNPTKTGYTFSSWDQELPALMPANDITIKAQYIPNQYALSFYDIDHSLIEIISVDYNTELSTIDLPEPTMTGYTFAGWHSPLPTRMPANPLEYYATYDINQYRVQYLDYDDNILFDDFFDYEESLTLVNVSDPTRYGYTFDGWDDTLPEIMPANDITIHAEYTAIPHTITFYDYDDTLLSQNNYDYASDLTEITEPQPTRLGYTFDGWDAVIPSTMPNNDISFKAVYSIITYQIDYELYEGVNGINPSDYQITSETIILDEPTKTGYTFDGWYDNDLFANSPIIEINQGSTGDITLYAKWIVNEHQLTYITFDAYDPSTDIMLSYGEEVIDAALGIAHTLALTSEGNIISWGFNLYGQLGDSVDIERSYLKDVTDQFILQSGEIIIAVEAGNNCSMVLTSFGNVFTFGENSDGQLGDDTTLYKNTPTLITSQFNLSQGETVIGIYMGGDNAAAVTSLGRIFTWGNNNQGQLGDGTTVNKSTPVDITSVFSFNTGEEVLGISIGNNHYLLYTSDNRVFSWGNNSSGQVGNGSITSQSTPLDITSEFNFSQGEEVLRIAAGELHSALVTTTGRLFMWGENMYGQLGDGTTIDKNTPTDITLQFMYEFQFNEKISNIALGESHSLIITSLGRTYVWGRNHQGQLGDGTLLQRNTPVETTSFFNLESNEVISFVSSGNNHQFAVTSLDRVFTWGYNTNGQLGDGTTVRSTTPVQISFVGIYDETSSNVAYNAALTSYDTTRTGYIIDGWYTDESCTVSFVSASMPDEDLVLYGKWMEDEA